ncbi:hypothetical protein HOLDEFILI_04224 [Holdemania filiformis DSM 12042]|uniref:Uncharacterized protein n=1 Tax=Holdemania filiformis DSM 12042 TaxID=545696 RepID=B9YEF0_9FIRM|nr:hypothetical protein HOLDEFILI_04224 [Holdemania filiformis DSM 12042]
MPPHKTNQLVCFMIRSYHKQTSWSIFEESRSTNLLFCLGWIIRLA